MTYSQAQRLIFATGVIPDGYAGGTARVMFAFDPESLKTLAIHESGYFTYHTPRAVDAAEALWLLINHPSSNASLIHSVTHTINED